MNAWMVGVLLLAGIVLGVLGAILSGKAAVPRWARLLVVFAIILFLASAIGDLVGVFLGYPNIYSSIRGTGYFENRYAMKMAALAMAFSLYLILGVTSHFFWRFKWQKAVSCIVAWFFLYYGAMAFLTNGQVFNPGSGEAEQLYVRIPPSDQFPKGEIVFIDKDLKQDRYYGITGKKPDAEVMKEYYDQHPDKRPGGTPKKQSVALPQPVPQPQLTQPQPQQSTQGAGSTSPAPVGAIVAQAEPKQDMKTWSERWRQAKACLKIALALVKFCAALVMFCEGFIYFICLIIIGVTEGWGSVIDII